MINRNHTLVSVLSVVLCGISLLLGTQEVLAANTSNVTVTNTPLPVQGTVSVGNPSTSPVNVKGVDEPARQPFVMFCGLGATDLSAGNAYCYPHINGSYQNQGGNVPAGKRFVIETVSGTYNGDAGIKPATIFLETAVGNTGTHTYFHANFDGTTCCFSGDYYSFVQPVRLYADAGTNEPAVRLVLSAAPTDGNFEIYLVGYLINLP